MANIEIIPGFVLDEKIADTVLDQIGNNKRLMALSTLREHLPQMPFQELKARFDEIVKAYA